MRLPLAVPLALALLQGPLATCTGRTPSPAAGVTYDCGSGAAFVVAYVDSTTAVATVDGTERPLARVEGSSRWTSRDSATVLVATADSASLTAPGASFSGCAVRNPELRRG